MMTGTPINRDSLLALGFVKMSWNNTTYLIWRGAQLRWNGREVNYAGKTLDVTSIEELSSFIKSLNIKKRPGVKTL